MSALFNSSTTAEEAAQVLASEISNKVVLVTGASPGGLGAEACRAIAKHGAKLVVLAGRSEEKLVELERSIKEETPTAHTRLLVFDLASLSSIRSAATAVNAYAEQVDVLINGGAIMMGPYATTEDGYESSFGTNHLGHFLFTNLIRPKLAQAPKPRVVNISSAGHRFSDVRWGDVGFSNGEKYDKHAAYGQSKTANMLFSVELAARWKDMIFSTVSLHPGRIITNLGRHLTTEDLKAAGITLTEDGEWVSSLPMKTIPEGAATYIVAAFDPSLNDHSGSYMVDCQVANELALPYALDRKSAARLWKLSEEMVGETFA